MSNIYTCPKCKEDTLKVEKQDDELVGLCNNCGYNFVKEDEGFNIHGILSLLKEYAFIIAIISILLIAFMFNLLSSQDTDIINEVGILRDDIDDDISTINSEISNIKTDIITHGSSINNLEENLEYVEEDVTQLKELSFNINNILSILNYTNSTIQDIYNIVFLNYSKTDVTMNVYNYPNQSEINGTYYSLVNIIIESNENIDDFELSFHYPYTNLIFEDYKTNDDFRIREKTFSNDSLHLSTIIIEGFGITNHIELDMNITWDTTRYTSKTLDMNNLIYQLKINDIYYEKDEINMEVI